MGLLHQGIPITQQRFPNAFESRDEDVLLSGLDFLEGTKM